MILTSVRAPLGQSVDDFSELLAVVSLDGGKNPGCSWPAFGFPRDPEKEVGHSILMDVLGIDVDLQ